MEQHVLDFLKYKEDNKKRKTTRSKNGSSQNFNQKLGPAKTKICYRKQSCLGWYLSVHISQYKKVKKKKKLALEDKNLLPCLPAIELFFGLICVDLLFRNVTVKQSFVFITVKF